jgi:NAD(P)H dehydrogenase (quinone)
LIKLKTKEKVRATKVSIILAHPNPGSFNHAIANAAVQALRRNGHQTDFHDLYKEDFDPILPFEEVSREAPFPPILQSYCDEISLAEGIIIVHPNWWGMPPAILKGWVDRVIRPGIAYEFLDGDNGEGVPRGLLKARSALMFNTSNTLPLREQQAFGDPLETIWRNCIFGLCGVSSFHRKTYSVVVTSTQEQRKAWLDDVGAIVSRYFPKEGNL